MLFETTFRRAHTNEMSQQKICRFKYLSRYPIWGTALLTSKFSSKTFVPNKRFTVTTVNVGCPKSFKLFRNTLESPVDLSDVFTGEEDYGLRIPRTIIVDPFSGGVCLGMSLEFISLIVHDGEPCIRQRIIKSANSLKKGATPTGTMIQAMYNSFLDTGTVVDKSSIDLYKRMFINLKSNEKKCIERVWQHLDDGEEYMATNGVDHCILQGIKQWIQENKSGINLRSYLFAKLERHGFPVDNITNKMIIEIEAIYQKTYFPSQSKYFTFLSQVTNFLFNLLDVKTELSLHYFGTFDEILEKTLLLDEGIYLLSFPKHAMVYISHQSMIYVFDPNFGLIEVALREKRKEIVGKMLLHWLSKTKRKWITIYSPQFYNPTSINR